jgi:hypothetical protein
MKPIFTLIDKKNVRVPPTLLDQIRRGAKLGESESADILVFRLGSGQRLDLNNINAASFLGAIEFAYKAIDKQIAHGTTLEVWRVHLTAPIGEYEHFNGGMKQGSGPSHRRVGRKKTGWGYWYSFPEGGAFTAKKVGSAHLDVLGKLAGYDTRGGHGDPGWWYISELPVDDEHKAAEKAFGIRIQKE